MPQVHFVTKNKAGKTVVCGRPGCAKKIEPGDKYYHWSFRYGGKHYRCTAHSPRSSERTQSKMSGAYAAIESVEDALKTATALEDFTGALESAADDIESVRDEYQDSFDNMPENFQGGSTGEEIQEKRDGLDSFADTLRTAASTIEDEWENNKEEKRAQAAHQTAEDALSEFEF